jgi:hypothetical protein
MKNKFFTIFTLMVVFSLMASSLSAQNKQSGETYGRDYPELGPDKTTNIPKQREPSLQVKALLQQQRQAKLSGDNSRVLDIQRQIDALTGESVTVAATQIAGVGYFAGNVRVPYNVQDNITNNIVFSTPLGTVVKGMTTGTEQRAGNIGRIWLAMAYGSTLNISPDTIHIYFSDNGGDSWSFNSFWIPGSNSKVNYDQMDMEIMEYTTGQKYVWVTFGATDNTGKQYADIIIVQTPTFAAGFYSLTWPGGSANTNVYGPRITSDNATYNTGSSWVFMIAGRDTLSAANTYVVGEKFVKCTNPFTVTPTLTYKSNAFFYNVQYGGPGTHYLGADHCDIAYYQSGGQDSLMVVESNLPDTSYIYCMRSTESPETGGVIGSPSLNGGGLSTGYQKQYARVTSNGNGSNMIMIAYRDNYNNSGDWDIDYARSNNGGISAGSWANGYIDGFASTTTVPWQPDLVGLRGTSSFKCSYVYFSSGLDSAMIVSAPNGNWGNTTRSNLTGMDVSIAASSHAAYRFVSGDSCFVTWSPYVNTTVWSATGCTGPTVIGISHNSSEIPKVYALAQNYPNPFNPSTNIKFGLPKSSIVKLTVFDITGRQVAVLVDGQLNAGNYAYDFDASNIASGVYFYKLQANEFTSVKKMLLVK